MIFKNMEFHNVSELVYDKACSAYEMLRVPQKVEHGLNDVAKIRNRQSTGIEIRFVPTEDEVTLTIKTDVSGGVSMPVVYYGSIQAGWQDSPKTIFDKPTQIVFKKPSNIEYLRKISREYNLPFSPDVVRLVLPVRKCSIIDIKGGCRPPEKYELPKMRYLAYGSSITHGSEAVIPSCSYVFRVAENMRADLINLGFAGSAYLEEGMADYIASRNDWDFATLELGINVIDVMEADEFKHKVNYFINKVAKENPQKKIVCIDLFYHHYDYEKNNKTDVFRNIVREASSDCGFDNVYYINGKTLMSGMNYISSDLEHPTIRGMEEIAHNLTSELEKILKL